MEASDFNKLKTELSEEITNLIEYTILYPEDKTYKILLKIARLRLQLFKINFQKK